MKRNQIQRLHVHFVPAEDGRTVAERANQYHIQIIERRLDASNLTWQEKIAVLKKIKADISL